MYLWREEVEGGWKKIHDFYSLPNIIRVDQMEEDETG
jgi:hypothetical protein